MFTTKRFEIKWRMELADVTEIKRIVKMQPGTSQVRTSRQFGWNNQPEVVRFNGTDETRAQVQHALTALTGVWLPIIYEVGV
jgi:hypothetical protein